VVLLVVGGIAAYIGYFALLVGAGTTDNTTNNTPIDETDRKNAREVGGALLLTGLAGMGVGIYLVATAHTTVTTSSGVTFTTAPAPRRKRPAVALTPRGLEF
jgi:hypothetical protein